MVPEHRRDGSWRPAVEDLALAIGVADYGADRSAIMGPSAARLLGAIPRALAVGIVAAPVHRSPLKSPFGEIRFSFRNVRRLDLQRVSGELVAGYCTTIEQTILDLAAGLQPAAMSDSLVSEAITTLLDRCDLEHLKDLAKAQRRTSTLMRLLKGRGVDW